MRPSHFKKLNYASQTQDKTKTHPLKKVDLQSSEAPKPFLPRIPQTRLRDALL